MIIRHEPQSAAMLHKARERVPASALLFQTTETRWLFDRELLVIAMPVLILILQGTQGPFWTVL